MLLCVLGGYNTKRFALGQGEIKNQREKLKMTVEKGEMGRSRFGGCFVLRGFGVVRVVDSSAWLGITSLDSCLRRNDRGGWNDGVRVWLVGRDEVGMYGGGFVFAGVFEIAAHSGTVRAGFAWLLAMTESGWWGFYAAGLWSE